MENNIITATFTDNSRVARTRYAYQYDYGQLLKVEGIEDLPSAFEVHFSNDEFGTATTQIGTDGLVSIPDAYLLPGTMIFAWIFLHSGEDDGETVYRIKIPVRARAEVSDTPPTPQEQSVITETIAALNAGVARAEAAAEGSSDNATKAESYAVGGTGTRPGEDTDNAKHYAEVAAQHADSAGYAWFDINDQDGELYVTVANNLDNDLTFEVNENTGELEVVIR